ncbi:MAG: N-6 DNA methylase [Treponema sp.]|jgi:predicted RNA methylase|nr:N-6 DNA methylase [Treponema sp.]
MDTCDVTREIASAFSLSPEAAQTARLLLEARAKTLDFTFEEYMARYHPEGIAGRDENLPPRFRGYVRFLGDDAAAVLRAGKGADFSTFVHECAHVFRRQLSGDLRDRAEKAFGVEGGAWSREKEELFARGLERWIKRRHGRDKTRAELYDNGKRFVDTVYRGVEHIVDVDPRMEAVYERLFEKNPYAFNQNDYDAIVRQALEGKLSKNSHVFLGMTPRIYEAIGFERLPVAITAKHLYSTLRASGEFEGVNYHDLGEDILRQLPEQLKKPLCIVQNPNNAEEIISVITLKDKKDRDIIVPVAQFQKGTITGTEININLVKTLYGISGLQNWLKAALDDNRLLYIDKKRTGPVLNGKLTRTVQDRSAVPPGLQPPDLLHDVSGFIPENIARYREEVKRRFPGRFAPGKRILYQTGQLAFDFSAKKEAPPGTEIKPLPAMYGEKEIPELPLPNTGENLLENFAAVCEAFESDPIEAARFLLRAMTKAERETALRSLRENGCTGRESYHAYFLAAVPRTREKPGYDKKEFLPYGAWSGFNSRLSISEREYYNAEALAVLEKAGDKALTETEKNIVRRYSGFGGTAREGERGVLYDYYTSPPLARLTWDLLEKAGGVKEGAGILEPSCGTGVFFSCAPENKKLSLTGVELDRRTAKIANALHAENGVKILNTSFEAFNRSTRAGNFDHVIGNAPFGERGADTLSLDMRDEKSLDNYFVSRSIDNLKDEGVMAIITAPGVLENKTNEDFRLSLNRKAQFVGAVKLPDRSFHHTHTRVQPDILLFRKYPEDIRLRLESIDEETFKTTPLYDGAFASGAYFETRPEHIAGELSKGSGQWGSDEVKGGITRETPAAILDRFTPAPSQNELFERVRARYALPSGEKAETVLRLDAEEIEALKEKKLGKGSVKIIDAAVYLLDENTGWRLASENKTLSRKLSDCKTVARSVREIRDRMIAGAAGDEIKDSQIRCRVLLDSYTESWGAPPEADADLKRFVRANPAVKGIYEAFIKTNDPLLESKNVYRKDVDMVDGHNPAIAALLLLREKMKEGTEENIRSFFPDTADSLIAEMRAHADVFITPEGTYRLREDFIAGDAWEQIDFLREEAKTESVSWKKEKLLYGAAELEKAVGWTALEDAEFFPSSSWIPQEIVRDWAVNSEALGFAHLQNLAKNENGKWGLRNGGVWEEGADPLIYYLNGQKQRSRFFDTAAYEKEHNGLFRSFVANHEKYRAALENDFNRKFKTHIVAPVKTYPVTLDGWKSAEAGGKTLKPHQWQSVHQLYRQGRGISALGTGFGKTVTAVGLMSLMRQEGKARRVFLQVPNNKVKDWIEEIKTVMPSLKIASIDPEESGYANRDRRYAKYQAMAGSDADVIIMPESAASEIQLSPENDGAVSKRVGALYKLEKAGGSARSRELALLRGELKAAAGKTNATVSFEDFGCDALVVDEAHRYKNLFSSSLSRETGLNDGRQSDKAMSLYKKSEYIRERNNGKNVFLLTATPLTNSPLEYYNMMRYVAPEELARMGVTTIDSFIREFANIEQGWLYDWGRGQAKMGKILTGFKNLSTLQNLFFTYTDLQNNPESAGIEKPLAENRPHIIPSDKTQTDVLKGISAELDRYRKMSAEDRALYFAGENFLTFYSRMRTASLDLELYDPETHKNWKNPKLDALARNAFEKYKETGGGQVVFCDRVFSSDGSFNIHEKIKAALVARGFNEKEICIVNGFTKGGGAKSDGLIEKEVSKAIAGYNAGKYKALIGSTACIGEGVNLQKNSSGVHHFDIPFRPSDFIQRNGRVDRQGNEQEKVGLHTYLAAGTIDNYSVNLVQRKAAWIDQLLRTKSDVFVNPNDENSVDADELLLALTEEWGDREAAKERREEIEREKQDKIHEAQILGMKTLFKNLSLARGSLESLPKNNKTKEHRRRLDQIASIESALKASPVFERNDLLESKEAFLYDAESGRAFRKGDIFVTSSGGSYRVESLNFKKQTLECKKLLSKREYSEQVLNPRGWYRNISDEGTFKLSDLSAPQNEKYSRNAVVRHFEKASPEIKNIVIAAGSKDFYSLPDEVKEKQYPLHAFIIREKSGYDKPLFFYKTDEGGLEATTYGRKQELLNPFSGEGREAIEKAAETGVKCSQYDLDDVAENLEETVPFLKDVITRGIKRTQEKEREENLKKEFETLAITKTGSSEKHLKSRVHLVSARSR